jgi:predicted RNase H-like nuclease (RuvC/YqgF family)
MLIVCRPFIPFLRLNSQNSLEKEGMQMKKILFTMVMIALSGLIFSGLTLAGTIEQVQVRQQQRIRTGIHNDQLTRQEARRLRHQQRRIHRLGKSYSRDGNLTDWQRRRLTRMQERADRQITRTKQNRRRNPYLAPFQRALDPYRRTTDPFQRPWR